MAVSTAPFPIVVLGTVSTHYAKVRKQRPLSAAKQRTLAALIAAGATGLTPESLAPGPVTSAAQAALRMSMARLREHLPDGGLADAVDGRYRLTLPEGDVDAWTLFRLAHDQVLTDVDDARLHHLLAAVEPYGGIVDPMLIEESAAELRRAQLRLIAVVGEQRPALLQGGLLDQLRAHLQHDPFNEHLLLITASGLARSGDRRAAIDVLARARREYADVGLPLTSAVGDLEFAFLDGSFDIGLAQIVTTTAPTSLPMPLADQVRSRFVGSTASLEELSKLLSTPARHVAAAAVTGVSGAGKTRLCAELAQRARERGFATVYTVATSSSSDAALGPFIAALPTLRTSLAELASHPLDAASRKAEMWGAASRGLADEAAGRPLLLIVDDAQWLDSQSSDLVMHLATNVVDTKLVLVVAGRDDDVGSTPWSALRGGMLHAGGAEVTADPLDEPALLELVKDHQPRLSEQQARGVAHDLLAATHGLPGVATVLLDSLDDDLPLLPSADEVSSAIDLKTVVGSLSDRARTVGVLGSVVGADFDVPTLAEVGGLSETEVLDGLDELVRRQLAIELSVVEFSIVHVLVQAALVESASRATISLIHRAAAEHFAADVHRRARHQAAAVPLVSTEVACASLIASADAYLDDGLHREATDAYRKAEALPGVRLDAECAGRYARALDLSGSPGEARRVRQVGFDLALAARDHSAALDIAVSGLPEAEPIDGDTTVVANLERIEPDLLTLDEQWRHVRNVSRQLAIVGRVDEAVRAAERSQHLARTSQQRLGSAVSQRFAISATSPPEARLSLLTAVAGDLGEVDVVALAEYLVLLALDHYESGGNAATAAACAQLAALGPTLPLLRRWHALLLEAMTLTDAGEMEAARRQRMAAYDLGLRCGFAEHANALLAAEFVDAWLRRSVAGFIGEVTENGAIDPARSVLTRAGAAIVLAAAGEHEQATHHAVGVARSVLASPVAQGTAALAMVSEVLAACGDPRLVSDARTMLTLRGNSMVVIGAGAASLGPVARNVAHLCDSVQQRCELLVAALSLAARSGSLLWQAVVLRDLYEVTEEARYADQFQQIVAGTSLTDLASLVP